MHDIWIPFSVVLLTVTALVNGKYRMGSSIIRLYNKLCLRGVYSSMII